MFIHNLDILEIFSSCHFLMCKVLLFDVLEGLLNLQLVGIHKQLTQPNTFVNRGLSLYGNNKTKYSYFVLKVLFGGNVLLTVYSTH